MNYSISQSNRLTVVTQPGEEFFVSPDRLISYKGKIKLDSRINLSVKNILASIGGKSLIINKVTAVSDSELFFSSKMYEHLHSLEMEHETIFLKPNSFFAFFGEIDFKTSANLSKLTSGESVIMMKLKGKGVLFFTSNGGYTSHVVDDQNNVFVEESCLLLYQGDVNLKSEISSVKNLFLSDEGYLLSFRGKGDIYVNNYKPLRMVKTSIL